MRRAPCRYRNVEIRVVAGYINGPMNDWLAAQIGILKPECTVQHIQRTSEHPVGDNSTNSASSPHELMEDSSSSKWWRWAVAGSAVVAASTAGYLAYRYYVKGGEVREASLSFFR